MQSTFRLHTQEINPAFLQSLKTLFANQEVEITVKPVVSTSSEQVTRQEALRQLIQDARQLIDDAHDPML